MTPMRSWSISVSRYWLVNAESCEKAAPVRDGEGDCLSWRDFLEPFMREFWRKLMNEVFPEFLAPITRMLCR